MRERDGWDFRLRLSVQSGSHTRKPGREKGRYVDAVPPLLHGLDIIYRSTGPNRPAGLFFHFEGRY